METLNFFKGYGKVNPIEDHHQQEASSKPQNPKTIPNPNRSNITKIFLISLTLVLILVICGALIGSLIHLSSSPSSLGSDSAESLRTVCAVTQHPDSCFATISSLNNPPKPDPVHFYNLSLQVTIQELKNLSSLPESLIPRSNDKRTESALRDCASLFDEAVSQLGRSFDEMKVGPDEKVLSEMKISDMQTWISAAMSDQETCLDGLEEMESSLVDEVKVKVRDSKDYMSNSLAILNNIKPLLQKFGLTMP